MIVLVNEDEDNDRKATYLIKVHQDEQIGILQISFVLCPDNVRHNFDNLVALQMVVVARSRFDSELKRGECAITQVSVTEKPNTFPFPDERNSGRHDFLFYFFPHSSLLSGK